MVKTKGAAASSERWEKAIPGAAASYKAGVERNTNWQENAIAGEENYKTGVTEAAAEGRRAAGIAAVTQEKWKKGASEKGASRIAAGMQAGKQEYNTKIGKVLSAIEGISIPDRTTDAATNVANRVTPLAVGLQEAKKRGEFR